MIGVEECVEAVDGRELLAAKRALSDVKLHKKKEQREMLFHTKCTIQGKVCMVIIDGESCANVASRTLVEKLKINLSLILNLTPTNGSIQIKFSLLTLGA